MEKIYSEDNFRKFIVRYELNEVFIATFAVVNPEAAMQKCREKMAQLGWKENEKTAYMMLEEYPCNGVGYIVPPFVNAESAIDSLF